MNNKYLKNSGLLLVIIFGIFFSFNRASALTLSPVRFEISGNPGDTLTEEITLINETQDIETFYSSFVNFEAQGETGSPAFVEPKDDLGTWMSTEESIVLLPQATQKVPLTIKIPENAEPGGHFAVVFFGTSPKGAPGQVSIGANTGILVLLSVNGDVKEGGGLLGFNVKDNKFWHNTLPVNFEYKFTNEGNDRIKPTGELKIKNTFFITADKLDGNPVSGNILPNSTRRFDITWIKSPRTEDYSAPSGFISKFFDDVKYQWRNFAFSLYTAKLSLTYGTQNILTKDKATFFVFPWQLLLVIFIILFIVIWGGKKLLKKYNKFIIEKARANIQ